MKAGWRPDRRRVAHGLLGRLSVLPSSLVLAGAVGACAMVGPDYAPPDTQMPDSWNVDLTRGLETGESNIQTWWTTLDDPMLDSLIVRAGQGNLTVKEAIARIEASRAGIGIVAGEELPQVEAPSDTNTIQYGRVSEGTTPSLTPGVSRNDTLFSAGLGASWEVDLWGRVARSIEAADADFQASVEDYRDVLVSLYASVASAYVNVRTFQQRIGSALGNVRTQRQTLRLVQERKAAGLSSDLDVAQAQLNLATTEAAVPVFRQQLASNIHALGVLLGERPSFLYAELGEPRAIPPPPAEVVIGLPRELLRQRPDVRSAERQLAAQTARIGVSTADLYPRFALLGSFAFQSFSPGTWFNGGSLGYGIGPSVQWNVFDGGTIRSRIDQQDAASQQLLARYEQTVLSALQETEDAMVAYVQERDRRDALARSVTAARKAVTLVQTLYVTGLTDFQNVQDTERRKFQQEDQLAASEGQVILNLIAIYRSLGGGWAARSTGTAASEGDAEAAAAAEVAETPPAATARPETRVEEKGSS